LFVVVVWWAAIDVRESYMATNLLGSRCADHGRDFLRLSGRRETANSWKTSNTWKGGFVDLHSTGLSF